MLKALKVIGIFKDKMCWYIYNKMLSDSEEKGTSFCNEFSLFLPSSPLLPFFFPPCFLSLVG